MTSRLSKLRKVERVKVCLRAKAATRIEGLNEVLEGGLPRGSTTIISGGPGTGKSVLALDSLRHGITDGEPGIFVCFEERSDAVRQNARTLGWDLATLEKNGKLFLFEARMRPEAVLSGDFNLSGWLAILDGKVRAMRARRIVFDAVDVLLRLYDNPARERQEPSALNDWLLDRGLTAILTVKAAPNEDSVSRYAFLDFMADCVIALDQRVGEQISTRRLRVTKYRGSGFARNEYPYIIGGSGIIVMPISRVELRHQAHRRKISSGVAELDAVMDGGYRQACSILFAGEHRHRFANARVTP